MAARAADSLWCYAVLPILLAQTIPTPTCTLMPTVGLALSQICTLRHPRACLVVAQSPPHHLCPLWK
eukprot:5200010-Amphidinium_carterae.1